MTQSNMDPKTLADQLDEIVPPGSDMVLDATINDPRLDVAKLLASYSNKHLNDTSRALIQDRMMLSIDEAHAGSWRRGSRRFMPLAAALALVASAVIVLTIVGDSNDPLHTLSQILNPDSETEVTEDAAETATPIPTLTPVPTATMTDVPAVIPTATAMPATATNTPVPTETPTEVIPTPTNTSLPPTATEAAPTAASIDQYVKSTTDVNVRAQPGTNSTVVTVVDPNDMVIVLGYDSEEAWALVELDDGTVGWISADLLGDDPIVLDSNDDNNDGDGPNRPPRPPRPPGDRPPGGNGRGN